MDIEEYLNIKYLYEDRIRYLEDLLFQIDSEIQQLTLEKKQNFQKLQTFNNKVITSQRIDLTDEKIYIEDKLQNKII